MEEMRFDYLDYIMYFFFFSYLGVYYYYFFFSRLDRILKNILFIFTMYDFFFYITDVSLREAVKAIIILIIKNIIL